MNFVSHDSDTESGVKPEKKTRRGSRIWTPWCFVAPRKNNEGEPQPNVKGCDVERGPANGTFWRGVFKTPPQIFGCATPAPRLGPFCAGSHSLDESEERSHVSVPPLPFSVSDFYFISFFFTSPVYEKGMRVKLFSVSGKNQTCAQHISHSAFRCIFQVGLSACMCCISLGKYRMRSKNTYLIFPEFAKENYTEIAIFKIYNLD